MVLAQYLLFRLIWTYFCARELKIRENARGSILEQVSNFSPTPKLFMVEIIYTPKLKLYNEGLICTM